MPWFDLAKKEIGVAETPGAKSNPKILQYDADAGHPEVTGENTPWCCGFCSAMLKRAGFKPTGSLMARSYLHWGQKLDKPRIGCIAVLWRGSPDSDAGHVGFVADFTDTEITLLGGNQGTDGVVSLEKFPVSRVLGYRWPPEPAATNGNNKMAETSTVKTNDVTIDPTQNLVQTIVNGALLLLAGKFISDAAVAHTLVDFVAPTVCAVLTGGGGIALKWLSHRNILQTNANTIDAIGK
jgi:uncharacterized protein (TIGR02594 family)